MATSINVNIRSTKLNQANLLTLRYEEAGSLPRDRPLLTLRLTDEQMEELQGVIMDKVNELYGATTRDRLS